MRCSTASGTGVSRRRCFTDREPVVLEPVSVGASDAGALSVRAPRATADACNAAARGRKSVRISISASLSAPRRTKVEPGALCAVNVNDVLFWGVLVFLTENSIGGDLCNLRVCAGV
jgi:hypothetical protein